MKVLDSSVIIAVLHEIKSPRLFDCILKLGHELVIPYDVCPEVMAGPSAEACERLIREKKIAVEESPKGTWRNRTGKGAKRPKGLGERGVTRVYEKRAGGRAYCILDDMGARRIAARRGVKFTGLLGLPLLMRDRGIISPGEFRSVMGSLEKSGFRMPP